MSKKTVGIIPIKLNNQRLPGKNTKRLGDKVLCQYLLDNIRSVNNIDEIYVYCSDESICQYIPEGIKFLKRSKELDGDNIKSKDILDKFVDTIDSDIYVLMHVTQPFVSIKSISEAVDKVKNDEYDSAFLAHKIQEFAWYNNSPINYNLDNVVKTQDLPPIYIEGEVFIFKKEVLTKLGRRIGNKPYIKPISWIESICIDNMEDFMMAEAVVSLNKKYEG